MNGKTTVQDLKREIPTGTVRAMIEQLELEAQDMADAIEQAADCLGEALAGRLVRRDAIPRPSRQRRGERRIPVAMYLAPKLALFSAMERSGVNNSEAALRALGKEAVVHVGDAA